MDCFVCDRPTDDREREKARVSVQCVGGVDDVLLCYWHGDVRHANGHRTNVLLVVNAAAIEAQSSQQR